MTELELDYCLILTIQNDFFENDLLECSTQSTSKKSDEFPIEKTSKLK